MSTAEILNVKEVASYLRIPVSTIYKLIQEGKLPAVKFGKHWRFMKKDIDHLFFQNRFCTDGRTAKGLQKVLSDGTGAPSSEKKV